MKQVPLKTLENSIIKPGFERQLKPLLMYRGSLTLGRAHRLWNLMASSMEHEATASDITQRLQMNAEYSQLCGPDKALTFSGVAAFCGRLLDNAKVMDEMPHLEEYIEWMLPRHKRYGNLIRVSPTTYRSRNMGAGGWRQLGKRPKFLTGGNVKQLAPIVYPFLIHDGGKPEHDLLKRVNAAVPKYLDPDLRADICQDIIVGILCGDFSEDNLTLPAKEMTKRVQQMFPTKYGPLSLDAIMPGTDNFRLMDTLSEEDSLWAKI